VHRNCSKCGAQLSFRNSFVWKSEPVCKDCLQEFKKAEAPAQNHLPPKRKNPNTAAILGFLFAPLGMLYVGRFGAAFLLGIPVLLICKILSLSPGSSGLALFIYFLYMIAMAIWAYNRANAMNLAAGIRDENQTNQEQSKEIGPDKPLVTPSSHTWTCKCGEINLNSAEECRVCSRRRKDVIS
jgi:hypothetical protein